MSNNSANNIFNIPKNLCFDSVIFDIGSNDGVDGLSLALENPHSHIFSFEPTPEMIEIIVDNYSKISAIQPIANYTLIPKAVSDFCGKTSFNVAGKSDWGCSSLNEFSPNLEKTWPGRTDLLVTNVIEVEVITLEKFINDNNIKMVLYIHSDTQGSDLKVLRSLGVFKDRLVGGVFEVASTRLQALYLNQEILEDAFSLMNKWDFNITGIRHNDPWCNEVNVYFHNPIWPENSLKNNRTAAKILHEYSLGKYGVLRKNLMKILRAINFIYQLPVQILKLFLAARNL